MTDGLESQFPPIGYAKDCTEAAIAV